MSTVPTIFWFNLHPFVFPVVKNNNVLLLNTKNMNASIFNQKEPCARLIERLLEPASFGVLEFTSDSDEYSAYKDYIDKICDLDMGVLTRAQPHMKRPAVLTPYLVRMHSTTRYDLPKPGSNITLVINDDCSQNCSLCSEYFTQFKCCTRSDGETVMDPQLVKDLFHDISGAESFVINVCGGNITLHPQLQEIITTLSESSINCRYHIHYKNCLTGLIKMIKPQETVVIIDFPVNNQADFIPLKDYTYNFIVKSPDDLETCRQYVQDNKIDNFYISIVDDGLHTAFLKEHVFILQDHLACGCSFLSFNERLKIVNNHYYYRTFILPNGDVFGSFETPAVANMYRNPISFVKDTINLFHKEQWDKSWDNIVCSNCLFKYICPLLSRCDFPHPLFPTNMEVHESNMEVDE